MIKTQISVGLPLLLSKRGFNASVTGESCSLDDFLQTMARRMITRRHPPLPDTIIIIIIHGRSFQCKRLRPPNRSETVATSILPLLLLRNHSRNPPLSTITRSLCLRSGGNGGIKPEGLASEAPLCLHSSGSSLGARGFVCRRRCWEQWIECL